jgi:myosin heavy subunit
MDTMAISMEDQKEVFRICFAILYLGNIEFTQNEKDESRVSNRDGMCIAIPVSYATPA